MSRVVQTVRFVAGLCMLAAGVVAAGPYVTALVDAHARRTPVAPPPATEAWVRQAAEQPAPPVAASWPGGAGTVPAGAAAVMPPPTWHDPLAAPSAPFVPRSEYRPPEPPQHLPPAGAELTRQTPALAAAYRSTLDVPPPPLLDLGSPPPLAVAWSAHRVAEPPGGNPPADTGVYTVRDGDDLTGIAMRLYGHAGGAQAIWLVNRDRLSDPNILPIGMELRIPPAWSVPAVRENPEAVGQVIEPGRRPAKVRVAPGETLESLAQRFYGDPAMASHLFDANRDLLRNPALVVGGMELRLP